MSRYNVVKFELNRAGVQELLKSSAMQSILESAAAEKAREAGDGYVSSVHVGRNRAYANINPGTKEAARDNYRNNTLEKVIRQ